MKIRPATPDDAAQLAELLNALDSYVGNPGDVYSAEIVLRDGFGADPAFFASVAEEEAGALIGYLLWYPAYCTDLAARKLWVSDLFVTEAGRGRGTGKALLRAAAAEAVARGYVALELPAWLSPENIAFYKGLGGKAKNCEVYRWEGQTLADLHSPMISDLGER